MKKTNQQIIQFINDASNYLQTHPDDNKLKYALTRMLKRAQAVYQSYAETLEDARIDNCVTDDKGVILHDERGNYKFTKESLKALNKVQRDLAKTEVEIEPYIATELPDDLEAPFRDAFEGFVIAEEA